MDQPPAITSAATATATVGKALSFKVTTTGYPAATLSETGALPGGVTFTAGNNETATISGTPAVGSGGLYDVNVTATNGVGVPASQILVLTVKL